MLPSPFGPGPGPDSSPSNPPIFIMNIVITLAILAIIASPIVNTIRRALLYRYLLHHGTRVDVTITSASSAGSGRYREIYNVIAVGIDPTTVKERVFTYRGTHRYMDFHEGRRVIVLVDPRNPSRYAFLR